VIDLLDREIELVVVPFGVAAATPFDEFYRVAFRKNVYRSPTSCRRIWLVYQSPMPHSGASKARGLTATAPPE
jgi:hypothetical protein